MFAVLSEPDKRFGRWGAEDFAATGRAEVEKLMERADRLQRPRRREAALDFGCGLGRVTGPLLDHFDRVVGVDISNRMIDEACRRNPDPARCEFLVNERGDLALFPPASFDLVYSTLVLQHLPGRHLITGYVREFIRTLAPGGLLVFQLPSHLPWRNKVQPRRRLYALMRRFSVPADFLYVVMRLQPMRMTAMRVPQINDAIRSAGGFVLNVDEYIGADGFRHATYYASR